MGLFSRFAKAITKAKGSPLGESMRRIFQKAPGFDAQTLPDMFHTSPRLDPVHAIASTIASAPWGIFKYVEHKLNPATAKPVDNMDIINLLDKPLRNYPELDYYAYVYLTCALLENTGDVFWYKSRQGKKIVELYIMPKAWCKNVPSLSMPYFEFDIFNEKTIKASPEDVVWFKIPDLKDPYGLGRGRAEVIGDEILADEYAAKYQKNVLYNDGTPPFVIFAPDLDGEEIKKIEDTWAAKFGGWQNAKKPPVLNWPNASIQQLATSPKELDLLETRKAYRDAALQHWQLPPELFGIIENSNRSTIDAAWYLGHKNAFDPRMRFIERVITRQLIQPDFDEKLCFGIREKVPEDEDHKLKVADSGASRGLLTRGEWKQLNGLEVDPKRDNVYIIPFNLVEVPREKPIGDDPAPTDAGSGDSDSSEGGDTESSESSEDSADKEDDKGNKSLTITERHLTVTDKTTKGERRFGEEAKRKIWDNFVARAASAETGFAKGMKNFGPNQMKRLNANLTEALQHTADIDEAINLAFKSTFGADADLALRHALAPAWTASVKEGFNLAMEVLGSPISFSLYKPVFNEWINSVGLDKCKLINSTTLSQLQKDARASIFEGNAAGESMDKLAERVRDSFGKVYDNLTDARAMNIARTETQCSVNFGQYATYRGEGVEKKEWLSAFTEDSREGHVALSGTVIAIDEAFEVEGPDGTVDEMLYPGDSNGSAGNVCQCMCTILPVINEET